MTTSSKPLAPKPTDQASLNNRGANAAVLVCGMLHGMRAGATQPDRDVRETTAQEVARARLRIWSAVACAITGIFASLALANAGWAIPTWSWFALAAICILLAAVTSDRAEWTARSSLLVAIIAFFAGLNTARTLSANDTYLPSVVRAMTDDQSPRAGVVLALEGVVQSTPRASPPPQGPLAPFMVVAPTTRLWIRADRVEDQGVWRAASGRVLVLTQGVDAPRVTAGQRVRVLGIYEPPSQRMNPGEPHRQRRAVHDGYAGILETSAPELVERVSDATGWGFVIAQREAMRQRAHDVFAKATAHAATEQRALARALLLGEEDDPATAEITQTFTRLGLSHVLSISGFHLTVMAMVALFVLRLTGDRGWLEPTVVAGAVLLYTAIVPLEAPILRSALMVLALLATEATGRRYDRVCVLGFITLALLVWRPLDITSLGFQLSVGLTAMLLWASEAMQWRLFGQPVLGLIDDKPSLLSRAFAGIKSAIAISVMCWLVSLPLLIHTTGLISPLGIAATLVVSPVIVLALWAGYISLGLGALASWLAVPAGWILTGATAAAAWAARVIDSAPLSSIRMSDPGLAWTMLATAALVILVRHGHRWKKRHLTAVIAICACSYALMVLKPWRADESVLRVTTLNVGDGTCMLISTPQDAVLWDCKGAGRAGNLPGIVAAARELGVHRVPRVVITHPDIDHFAGLFDVIEALAVREVLVPDRFIKQSTDQPGGAASVTLRELAARNVRVSTLAAGDTLMIGSVRGTVLSPQSQATFTSDNDHSITMLLEAATTKPVPSRVLLTGDMGPEAIDTMLGSTLLPAVDIFELPHHGSFNVAAQRLIAALQPRIVLQSTGPRRLDDPRWADSRDIGTWLVTARNGAIDVKIGRDGTLRTQTFAPVSADRR